MKLEVAERGDDADALADASADALVAMAIGQWDQVGEGFALAFFFNAFTLLQRRHLNEEKQRISAFFVH